MQCPLVAAARRERAQPALGAGPVWTDGVLGTSRGLSTQPLGTKRLAVAEEGVWGSRS